MVNLLLKPMKARLQRTQFDLYTVEPLYKDIPEIKTPLLIRTPSGFPARLILRSVQKLPLK